MHVTTSPAKKPCRQWVIEVTEVRLDLRIEWAMAGWVSSAARVAMTLSLGVIRALEYQLPLFLKAR